MIWDFCKKNYFNEEQQQQRQKLPSQQFLFILQN